MITVFGSKVGDEEIAQVSDSLSRQWLGMGSKVDEFEKQFSGRLNLDHFLLVDSGSNALYMAVELLGLPSGSEIILPSFTWVSCAQAIILAGHKPVFCDVCPDTLNATADTIAPHITDKTAAVMVVHYGGKPVDMDPVIDLGYPVIEDAAHAVDSYYKGKACGSIGEMGIYSFDAVKNLTTGEGGGITMKGRSQYERARLLRYCGIGKSGFQAAQDSNTRWWEYHIAEVFIKMLPTDIAAGIGLAQLKKIDAHQQYRRKIWDTYQNAFMDKPDIKTPAEPEEYEKHSYFTYLIQVPRRNELAKYLYENGVYSTLRYHPLHLNPLYRSKAVLPFTEQLNETGLNIPLHPNLSGEDVELIISLIHDFYSNI